MLGGASPLPFLTRDNNMKLPFQLDRPVFVVQPFTYRGTNWTYEDHFPWKEMNMNQEIVQTYYSMNYLRHSADSEAKMQVGDGLEAVDLDGLHQIVDEYNDRIKLVTKTNTDFLRRKCPKSKIADKQRGLLRSWRRNNLTWLEKAEDNK